MPLSARTASPSSSRSVASSSFSASLSRQIGTVVAGPTDYYSMDGPAKGLKNKSIAEQLLAVRSPSPFDPLVAALWCLGHLANAPYVCRVRSSGSGGRRSIWKCRRATRRAARRTTRSSPSRASRSGRPPRCDGVCLARSIVHDWLSGVDEWMELACFFCWRLAAHSVAIVSCPSLLALAKRCLWATGDSFAQCEQRLCIKPSLCTALRFSPTRLR